MKRLLLLFAFSFIFSFAFAEDCPMHASHKDDVDRRGDAVMGFDHLKSEHHFRITEDGGAIEAEAKDPEDRDTIARIRAHFEEIARSFSEGNFAKPEKIHGKLPPGASTMAELRNEIQYSVEETKLGGRVKISTTNPQALEAIHAFLRFQIEEHHTGD